MNYKTKLLNTFLVTLLFTNVILASGTLTGSKSNFSDIKLHSNSELLVMEVDLEMSISQSTENPSIWNTYSVTATITNTGSATATGITVGFVKPAGVVYSGGNEYSASQGSFKPYGNEEWTVGSIAAGNSATITFNLFSKVTNAGASYVQVLSADQDDPDSTPRNGTPPTPNEDDEASTSEGPPSGQFADLKLADFQGDFDANPGDVNEFVFVLINSGNTTATGDYDITFYLSDDSQLSGDDLEVGNIITGNTPVGQIQGVQAAITVPGNMTTGNYQLIGFVDSENAIVESNETNNLYLRNFSIEVPPTSSPDDCSFETDPFDYGPQSYTIFNGYNRFSGYSFEKQTTNNTGLGVSNDFLTVNYDFEGEVIQVDNVTRQSRKSAFSYSSDGPVVTITETRYTGDINWTTEFAIQTTGQFDQLVNLATYTSGSSGYFVIGSYRNSDSGNFIFFTLELNQNGNILKEVYDQLPSINVDYPGFGAFFQARDNYIVDLFPSNGCLAFLGFSKDDITLNWSVNHACDLPSNDVADIQISKDGNYIYAAHRNNSQALLTKFDATTGDIAFDVNLSRLYTANNDFFVTSFFKQILQLQDGSIVTGHAYRDFNQGGEYFFAFGKITASGDLVWYNTIPGFRTFRPQLESPEGGIVFSEDSRDQFNSNGNEISLLKVTSTGQLNPECGGTPPGGNPLGCDFEYTFSNGTLTITGAGFDNPHYKIKVYSPSWSLVTQCTDNCSNPFVINDLNQSGNYHVEVYAINENWVTTCNNITDVSDDSSIDRLQTEEDKLVLFPNPAIEYLNIAISDLEGVESFFIQNGMGQNIYQMKKNQLERNFEIPISHLNAGMHIVGLLYDNGKVVAKKFIKVD